MGKNERSSHNKQWHARPEDPIASEHHCEHEKIFPRSFWLSLETHIPLGSAQQALSVKAKLMGLLDAVVLLFLCSTKLPHVSHTTATAYVMNSWSWVPTKNHLQKPHCKADAVFQAHHTNPCTIERYSTS